MIEQKGLCIRRYQRRVKVFELAQKGGSRFGNDAVNRRSLIAAFKDIIANILVLHEFSDIGKIDDITGDALLLSRGELVGPLHDANDALRPFFLILKIFENIVIQNNRRHGLAICRKFFLGIDAIGVNFFG